MAKTISSLKAQKNKQNRVSVYLDGDFAFGLSRFVAGWLAVGQVLDEAKIEELIDADRTETAYQAALNYLKYRPRSEAEVRIRLQKHDIDPQRVDKILDRLRNADLVNDRKFAEYWVSNRNEFSPRGVRALRYELRGKHIEDEIIDEVLEATDEETLAYRIATKRAERYGELERQAFIKKLSGFLSQKGFNVQTIIPVTHRVWDEKTGATLKS
jgi:regulatory protein